jgi:nucleoside-diphosphate-sugar epimerase
MNELHVVLGAGQIGATLAQRLLARGKRVRQVRRGQPDAAAAASGVEWVRGDVSDPAFAAEAMRGAAVAYDCVNPNYDEWPVRLPPLRRAVLDGAARSGARLVQLDNVYMLGLPSGPMTEQSPVAPVSKKGALRAQLAEETLEASRRGDVRVAIARASDFYGPDIVRQTTFGPHFFERLVAGKAVYAFGDPELPHSYAYGPDVAEGLARLGCASDDVWGQVWHLPHAPAVSTREIMALVAGAMGYELRVQRVPRVVLRTIGLFDSMLREVAEMTYQWAVPFVVDDAKWRGRFGGEVTPLAEGAQEMARWAVRKYAGGTAVAA